MAVVDWSAGLRLAGRAVPVRVASGGSIVGSYTGGGLNVPSSVAIDASSVVWLSNSGSNTVSAFTPTGNPIAATGFAGAGIAAPVGLAINLQ